MPEPIVSRPGEGELHERSDGYRLIRVATDQISAIEIDFDQTLVVEPHTHPDHVDSFLVLEGEVEFTAGDETVVLGPGSFFSAPPGARHGFRSAGGRARVLNLHTPDAGFADGIRRTTAESG
ncbi:MAG TPA: cupin domain-containing protein [Gaiellaceae bacterium]|nr:cupin domain-containing protein [Gaiellaceae bacterium]